MLLTSLFRFFNSRAKPGLIQTELFTSVEIDVDLKPNIIQTELFTSVEIDVDLNRDKFVVDIHQITDIKIKLYAI